MSKDIFGKLLSAPCSAFTRHNRRGVGHQACVRTIRQWIMDGYRSGPVDDDAPTCLGQDHDADLLPVRWYGFQLVG